MTREKKIDIYDYDKQLKLLLRRIKKNEKISEKNKKTILKFYRRLLADNLSKPRVIYYPNRLSMIATWIKKDFDKAMKKDVEEVLGKINRMDYTEWTKKDYRVTLLSR